MRSAYYPHEPVTKAFLLPSMAKQSMKDECDINLIMAKFQKTGLIEHVKTYGMSYGDMPDLPEFVDAMNLITDANSMFAELPATVRNRFKNDPKEFLDFVSDDDNRNELVELGLIAPTETPEAPSSTTDDPEVVEEVEAP